MKANPATGWPTLTRERAPLSLSSATSHGSLRPDRADDLPWGDELGLRTLVAHCHLGRFYRRAGRPQEAEHHVTTATTMYRAME